MGANITPRGFEPPIRGGGNIGGGVGEPPNTTQENACDIHKHNLSRPAIRNALNDAWNRSQYSRNKKSRERNAREQGGLLSSVSKNRQIAKRTNHRYKRPASELRTALTALTIWAAGEMAVPDAGQTFDYVYHTHPFEQGDDIPGEIRVGDPHIGSDEDWAAARSLNVDGIIMTSKYFLVQDLKRGFTCIIDR